jgi:hypothetical protein
MAITVKHNKVSTIPDGDDSSVVRPSDWNADHTLTGLGTAAELDAGVPNGVATLDAGGKVPITELPAAILGALNYQGTWDASTNTPTLTSSVGTKGYYYVVSVAGNTNLNGITDWLVGDWAVYNGTIWQKVDNTDAVTSVNGFTGTVVLTTTNVAEGTNEYFTQAKARTSISAGTGISYNNTTGVVTNAAPDQTVAIASGTGISVTGTYPNFTVANTAPSLGGDVVGPASATDNAIARFDTTTGKLLQNSVVTVGDTGAVTGVTTLAASTSVTTPIVQATNSAGGALRNASGTSQLQWGGGGGNNVSVDVAININPANAQVDLSPTGTGIVRINPATASSMNNVAIGATTPLAGSFTDLSVTGTTSFDGSQGTAGQVLTSAGSGNTPTWTTPTTGTVTSVTGTAPVASSGGNTPAISLAANYGDTQNPYASKTANFVLAAPNGSAGAPTFRAVVAADIPTLNQNTTGSAATLTTTRSLWGQSFNGSADISAPLYPAVGSASLPAYSATGDTNTGMFFPAADTIAFAEGGVESMRITSAGAVGIGTSSPATNLEVFNATNADQYWRTSAISLYAQVNNTNGTALFGTLSNHPLTFWTNVNERMRISASGGVSIGNTTDAGAGNLRVTGSITSTTLTAGSVLFSGASGLISQNNANLFWDNTNARLGVSTATPTAPIQISQTANGATFTATTLFKLVGSPNSATNQQQIIFTRDRNPGVKFAAAGAIGLNSYDASGTTPFSQLTFSLKAAVDNTDTTDVDFLNLRSDRTARLVAANTGSSSLVFESAATPNAASVIGTDLGSSNGALAFWTSSGGTPAERMRINNIGSVGIGVNNPATRLELGGASTGQTILFSNTGTNGTPRVLAQFQYKTASLGASNLITANLVGAFDDTSDLRFFTAGGVEKMRIFPSGGVSIGNTTDAGTGGLRVSGLIYPQQATTAGAPAYVKGAIYFDTTLNKLRVGGATAWETITSV